MNNNKNKSSCDYSKIISDISASYNKFLTNKKSLLAHKKIIKYLFQKSLIKLTCGDKIINFFSDKDSEYFNSTTVIRVDSVEDGKIHEIILKAQTNIDTYHEFNKSYNDHLNKYQSKNFNIIKFNDLISLTTPFERKIENILEQLGSKYNLSYIYKWSFFQQNENLRVIDNPQINFSQNFTYDFFVIMTYRGRLIIFIIDIKNYLTKSQITSKQIILFYMSVHYLLLNENNTSDIKNIIISFIKKILSSSIYISENYYVPNGRLTTKSLNLIFNELNIFYIDYKNNHNIYLKSPNNNEYYDSDDDEYFDKITKKHKTSAQDDCYIVSEEIFDKILSDSLSEYTGNIINRRTNDIIVELLGPRRI
ncbi:hypothetical protein QLL95_gp0644 [Cotonvirus japonicus]|uniref:Uncharacterized protein n=1 Tax=Cotonvirus japonicus TaxID=2811091 RepID=A0ABM7NTM3_9VIRU|nr:hypothetical protein QLL95_gp0644 [Cotonvirus japonicus]BCS83479.1 hypothetical protein [Cotonvirus japonicus]